jgi:hypothetical protein
MKISWRTFLIISILGLFFLVGLLFPSFILDNFVTPIALVLWLFWRILQSVDQEIYWVLLIISAAVYFFIRLSRLIEESPTIEQIPPPDSNAMLERINYWRTSIRLTVIETSTSYILEHNLGKMLAALYASRQSEAVLFEIYDALKLRQMPLPEPIYAFLFGAESSGSRRSVKQILHSLRDMPRKRIRRWTGREAAEYYQSLEQVLKFMESSLENKHDDEHFDAHHD